MLSVLKAPYSNETFTEVSKNRRRNFARFSTAIDGLKPINRQAKIVRFGARVQAVRMSYLLSYNYLRNINFNCLQSVDFR